MLGVEPLVLPISTEIGLGWGAIEGLMFEENPIGTEKLSESGVWNTNVNYSEPIKMF